MKIDLAPELQPTKNGEPPKLNIFYYTDPDCSWCWAAEPQIKKIMEEYSGQVRIIYRMGGLLENWDTFYDEVNRIGRPEQAARHWLKVARISGMPIDEKIWYEDPPTSTYPGCIAYKAAFFQGSLLAEAYLRRLREAVLTECLNISRENILFGLAQEVGLEMDRFREDFLTGRAQEAFHQDLSEARGRGITAFPTLVFRNQLGQEITLTGYRRYKEYEDVIKRLSIETPHKMPLLPIIHFVRKYGHVATQEVATVYDIDHPTALNELESLIQKDEALKEEKAGSEFWRPIR